MDKFWEHKSLKEMNQKEWESLCDRCAKCCLEKLQDEDTGQVYFTNVACRLLDTQTCQCSNYKERQRYVHSCIRLTPEKIGQLNWLPSTCAYRLLNEGKALPHWHPLITGNPHSTKEANQGCHGKIISEKLVSNLEHYICDWPS